MNSSLVSVLRAAALATTLFSLTASAFANSSVSDDPANQLLASTGTLPVKSAGPYVEAGTFRIQVSAKLGRPTERLADGTWLYKNFLAENSVARGTLIVRFNPEGRVSELSLAAPSVVANLIVASKSAHAPVLVASQASR